MAAPRGEHLAGQECPTSGSLNHRTKAESPATEVPMPATRHTWMHDYHTPNVAGRSLLRPYTIVDSADIDVPLEAGSGSPERMLRCSQYDVVFPHIDFEG